MFDDPIVLPAAWVPLAATVIPVLSALAVRARAARGWYVAAAVVLSAVLAGVEAVTDGQPDTIETVAVAIGTAFVAQLAAYLGVWKPAVQINDRLLPTRGLVGTPLVDLRAEAIEDMIVHGEPQDSEAARLVAGRFGRYGTKSRP